MSLTWRGPERRSVVATSAQQTTDVWWNSLSDLQKVRAEAWIKANPPEGDWPMGTGPSSSQWLRRAWAYLEMPVWCLGPANRERGTLSRIKGLFAGMPWGVK